MSGAVLPEAAAQATAEGRAIAFLTLIGGRVYASYGDYDANTGPIHVESVPATSPLDSWTDHVTAATEQTGVFRLLGDGRILVPHVDPQGGGGGYTERSAGGTWTDKPDAIASDGPEHVFDIVEFAGSLWASGSAHTVPATGDPSDAIVWRSTDGGATWSESFRDSAHPNGFARFYYLAPVGDTLYVRQAVTGTSYAWTSAGGWGAAGNVLPAAAGGPGKPWADGYLLPSDLNLGGGQVAVSYFDGSTSTEVISSTQGWDIGDDGNLYWLTSDGIFNRLAAPGGSVTDVLHVHGAADLRSLCILPGSTAVLFGATDSTVRLAAVT